MAENSEPKLSVWKRRADRRREKAQRTGDSTEKVAERGKRGGDPSLREAQQRAGVDIAAGGGAGMNG